GLKADRLYGPGAAAVFQVKRRSCLGLRFAPVHRQQPRLAPADYRGLVSRSLDIHHLEIHLDGAGILEFFLDGALLSSSKPGPDVLERGKVLVDVRRFVPLQQDQDRLALDLYCLLGMSRGMEERSRLSRSEEHTSELQSRVDLVCRLLLEKKK